jgi:hypothetical protein
VQKIVHAFLEILFACQKFVTCNYAQDPGNSTHVGKRVLESQNYVRSSQNIDRGFLEILGAFQKNCAHVPGKSRTVQKIVQTILEILGFFQKIVRTLLEILLTVQ